MKEFLLVYRADWGSLPVVSTEETQARTKGWMDWVGGIAAQNKLIDRGNRLTTTGRIVRAKGSVTDGPYAEIKETIGGYTLVKVNSYDEAVQLAQGCPVLTHDGCVEVREVNPL